MCVYTYKIYIYIYIYYIYIHIEPESTEWSPVHPSGCLKRSLAPAKDAMNRDIMNVIFGGMSVAPPKKAAWKGEMGEMEGPRSVMFEIFR